MAAQKEISRRRFLGLIGAAAVAVHLPITACHKAVKPKAFEWTEAQSKTLLHLLHHLWPATEGVPSLDELNTLSHCRKALKDARMKPLTRKILKSGPNWLEEESQEVFSKAFTDLNEEQSEKVLRNIEEMKNGKKFLVNILNLISESLLIDPLYGVNQNKAGWKWLHHIPGNPRPTSSQLIKAYGEEI